MSTDESKMSRKVMRYVPHGFVAVVFAYMVWVRSLPYSSMVTDEGVQFSANDSWYHIRVVSHFVENYPTVFPFDPWTYFPYGSTSSSGFGGLFDQIIATVALIVGLGDPSGQQVEIVTAFAPAVFGAATAIPVYLLARRLTDRWVALLAPLSLALFTGQFLNRTTFGNVQHEAGEAFFVGIAVLGFILAVERAYTEKPTFAHLRDGDLGVLSGAVLGGLALAAYMLTWPASVYLLAPFGAFLLIQMVRDDLNGRSTEYLGLSVATFFFVAFVPVAIYTFLVGGYGRVSGPALSALHPVALLSAGAGALFLHFLHDYLQGDDKPDDAYPVAVGGVVIVGLVFLFATGLISLLESLVTRMYSFGLLTSEGALTVSEIQPAGLTNAVAGYGLLLVVAVIGIAFLINRVVRENRPAELIVLLWSINMFTAYFTQARFGYYLAVSAAVLVAYGIHGIIEITNVEELSFESWEDLKSLKGYQVITFLLIVFLFLPGNVVAIAPAIQPAWNSVGGGADQVWHDESMGWMSDNTPAPPMEFNDVWEIPADGDFEYPVSPSPTEGAYGVMSWWDYGHWITMSGERIPNANPFQEGNIVSSLFFTAQSEERADLLLEALPSVESGSELEGMSNDELRSVIENQNEQERYEDTRYVVIDDQMAAGKFGAIATWTEFGQEEPYYTREEFTVQENSTANLPALGPSYENTTLSRLYYDDANEMDGYRLVHETETYTLIGNLADLSQPDSRPRLNSRFTRAHYNDSSAVGFRLSQVSNLPDGQMIRAGGGSYLYDVRGTASVKTFERVEGATLIGQADVSEPRNVTAFVRMRTTNTERSFPYTRRVETDADGSFEVTVPYPTVDDVSVEEGGTNASVESTGPYQVYVGNVGIANVLGTSQVLGSPTESGTVNVTESAVYGGDEVEVSLEEVETGNETANDTAGNETGNTTDGTTDGGASDGASDEGTDGSTSNGSTTNTTPDATGAETQNGS